MKGMIEWFARNSVAANLLMVAIFLGGAFTLKTIPLEIFPDFQLDQINIRMQYRGATPAEVEESVVIRIEEAIQDLDGIKQITSRASEGSGSVQVEVATGFDPRELLEDIKNRVDAITTFPDETERPLINVAQRRWGRDVVEVIVAGDMPEGELKRLGERVHDEIVNLPGVSQAELHYTRPSEIAIEVSEDTLQRYGLTFREMAQAVRDSSVDLPAGTVRTEGGDVLLRTKGRAYTAEDFEKIRVLTREDGTYLTIGDIANVQDGFEEPELVSRFNGKPAVMIEAFRIGDQNAIDVAQIVKDYVEENQSNMPPGVDLTYWQDDSKIVKGRLRTLTNSAMFGGILVFIVLMLFLRLSLAFWVCLGIPIAFMGAIALMPTLGVTINIFSLFAFILVLGIVVDDAIVTGESVYSHMRRGEAPLSAAISGTKAVAVPVTFGILTTMAAFLPLGVMEGDLSRNWKQLPMIVIPVLFFSLVESKLILPAHLKHLHPERESQNAFARFQRLFANGLETFVHRVYQPFLSTALRRRYLTLSIFLGFMILFFGMVKSGFVRYTPFPRVQDEEVTARLQMPLGTPIEVTKRHVAELEEAALALQERHRDPQSGQSLVRNIHAGAGLEGDSASGEVEIETIPPEQRPPGMTASTSDLADEWREMVGPIPGAEELAYDAEIGWGGEPIDIQLTGPSFDDLNEISDRIKKRLGGYAGVFDITDSFQNAKDEIKLRIKPKAEHLGLTMRDLGEQVRQAFYGLEAQRIPREKDDVRVMVRYPEKERRSLESLETMRIRTPDGAEVPFSSVAEVETGSGLSTIRRIDRNRAINVTADVDKENVDMPALMSELRSFVAGVVGEYPTANFTFEGEAREEQESYGSLLQGMVFVLFAIYALMAIPFRSYSQPLLVMSVIPFGLLGAILGHVIMGMSLSMLSIFGMLALSGVVVNDSLVLVDYVNRHCREGMSLMDAVRSAGVVRFRPILLTSLTTFAGLLPMIFEKSTQAQFLIPMAVSLGFGVLFATFITLILVPINYLLLEDFRGASLWYVGLKEKPGAEVEKAPA